jgi:hypothetical protein
VGTTELGTGRASCPTRCATPLGDRAAPAVAMRARPARGRSRRVRSAGRRHDREPAARAARGGGFFVAPGDETAVRRDATLVAGAGLRAQMVRALSNEREPELAASRARGARCARGGRRVAAALLSPDDVLTRRTTSAATASGAAPRTRSFAAATT